MSVKVKTTNGRGMTIEELSEDAVNRIIMVSDTAPREIRDQALAYRERIKDIIQKYMKQAVLSDRTTMYNLNANADRAGAAKVLKDLRG